MRKITLLFIVIAFVSNAFAQRAYLPEANKTCDLTVAKHYTPSEYQDLKSSTLWGDVIWEEDFSGGIVPTDWLLVDNNGLNYICYWSDDAVPGQTGTYSGNNSIFESTTASDGYIMISGDIYNMGSGSFVDMDSYFIAGPINCDTSSSVMVKFEQYFRNCCSSASTSLNLSISTDNINWTDYSVINGVAINAHSENPDVVTVNITQIAAGQSTVYLKWHKSGASHYFWAIDDIQLVTAPQNEIKFAETYMSAWTTLGHSGYYSMIPENQVTETYFAAEVVNAGDQVQTDVTANIIVVNGAGTEVYNQLADTSQLSFDSIAYLEMPINFEATLVDTYTASFECYQNEVDEIPENNIADPISFDVVSNKIYARDVERTGTITPDFYVDGADGDYIGVNYFIANDDTVKSISVYVDYRSDVDKVLIGQIYKEEALVIESEEYYITASDLGTWVELDLITVNTGDDVLLADNFYDVGVELYWGGDDYDLWIGSDDTDVHLFSYESSLRIGASWYWISEVPMVRLNFASAVTPPQFTSAPLITIPLDQAYNYTAMVADQGYAVSFDVTTNVEVGITDAASGLTTVISTPTPESVGLVVGDRYRVAVVADNGFGTNEQYYYVEVTPAQGAIDENNNLTVSIYPNPAQNELFVSNSENADIYVYNLLGELITNINNASSFTRIDLSNIAQGSYIITVIKGDKVYSEQFNRIK